MLLDEARPIRYESVPALGATMADIDEAHLWTFLREFEGGAFEEANASGYPTAEVWSEICYWQHRAVTM